MGWLEYHDLSNWYEESICDSTSHCGHNLVNPSLELGKLGGAGKKTKRFLIW